MQTTLSTKGQIVLPKQARQRLRLQPGSALNWKIQGDSIVLTPVRSASQRPKLVRDVRTGLMITKSAAQVKVTSQDVRAALADFP